MEKVKINHLFNYKFLSALNASPDGKHIVYTESQACEDGDNYHSALWLLNVETHETRKLTSNKDEKSCIWLDDESILFSSKRDKFKEGETSFYKLSIYGGEAEKLFTIKAGVGTIKNLQEDLYFVTAVKSANEEESDGDEGSEKDKDEKEKEKLKAKEGKDFLIFDEIPFWANGKGVVNKKRNCAMVFVPSTGELKDLTSRYFNVSGAKVSKDCTKILYWGHDYTDMKPGFEGLYEYDVNSGETVELLSPDKLSIHFVEYFQGDILVQGSTLDRNTSQSPKLYLIKDKTPELFMDMDGALGSSPGADTSFGGGKSVIIEGDKLYASFNTWGVANLISIDKESKEVKTIETFDGINCFDIIGDTAYAVGFEGYKLQEIYTLNLHTGAKTVISEVNKEYMDNHSVSVPEHFVFTTKAGHDLEGWVIKPVNYVKGNKYPGVLQIHGGPKVAYGAVYHHEMQCMASKGMFVFYTNPRGSDGRGDEFSTLAGKLGEIDYEDLMEFTDEVLRRYEDIDEQRIGACGGSYGGFMVNWIIGHTNRFKAACAQRSISNYFSKCLTTDIGYYHNLSQVGASPWDNPEKMWYHSPLKYVNNAVTPTLFIQSDEDYRCWMSEPLQMFTALKQKGIPSKVVLFHGDNHELSRAGRPSNRIVRLEEICGWFEKYL